MVIQRAGDVIPQIVKVLVEKRKPGTVPFEFPTHCPSCRKNVEQDEDDEDDVVIRCNHGLTCPAQQKERLRHFVSRNAFDIEGLGEKQVAEFFENGWVESPADIFKLEKKNEEVKKKRDEKNPPIEGWEGWGEQSVKNLFDAINDKRKISFERFLFALGIRHIGENTSKIFARNYETFENLYDRVKLAAYFEVGTQDSGAFDELHNVEDEALKKNKQRLELEGEVTNIDGIGNKVAESLIEFFIDNDNQKVIDSLQNELEEIFPAKAVQSETAISGKTIVFTGTMEKMSRAEAKAKAESMGAKVSGSVSAKTDIVVAGPKAGSKLKDATDLGVKVIDEDAWIKLAGS